MRPGCVLRRLALLAVAIVASAIAIAPAQAKKKLALVIGNNDYEHVRITDLERAIDDAEGIAERLSVLGFRDAVDTNAARVIPRSDLSRQEILRLWVGFLDRLEPGDVAVFSFSGHGTSHSGQNYLLPVDMGVLEPGGNAFLVADKLKTRAVALDELVGQFNGRRAQLQAGGAASSVPGDIHGVFIIDACRNTVLPEDTRFFGSLPSGFDPIPPQAGTFVMQSAAKGQTALDHLGHGDDNTNYSVFTRVLLELLAAGADRPVSDIAKDLKAKVYALALRRRDASGADAAHIQTPVYHDGFLFRTTIDGGAAEERGDEERQRAPAVIALSSAQEQRFAAATRAAQLSGDSAAKVLRDCDRCPEMVIVAGRPFRIGSPDSEQGRFPYEQAADIALRHTYAIGKHEVTWAEWQVCVENGGCPEINNPYARLELTLKLKPDQMPMINVSWEQAGLYAAWLSKVTGKRYRLPTEAEWEFAARANASATSAVAPFSFGAEVSEICTHANGADRSLNSFLLDINKTCSDGYARQAPVGSMIANRFGLHDMHGNVSEWTADCWADAHAPGDGGEPRVGEDNCQRTVKGGSWQSTPAALRTAWRTRYVATMQRRSLGFRVARDVDGGSAPPQ